MTSNYNILIVDDHPMTVDGYQSLLTLNKVVDNPVFKKTFNCEEAFKMLHMLKKSNEDLNFAIVDYNLPPYEKEKIMDGSGVAKLIRQLFPNCKLAMLTMHKETLLINNVFKTINPECFISKNDINFNTFPKIMKSVIEGDIYKSPTIVQVIQDYLKSNLSMDEFDIQIIMCLAEGKKTKDLPNYIDLSLSAIEKRKAFLKRELTGNKASDEALIQTAKNLKLI